MLSMMSSDLLVGRYLLAEADTGMITLCLRPFLAQLTPFAGWWLSALATAPARSPTPRLDVPDVST